MIEIGIDSKILETILDGRKTVEGRLGRGKFLTLNVGDVISVREDVYQDGVIVRSSAGKAHLVVDNLRKFDSFREMLNQVGHEKAIPGASNLDDAAAQYAVYYSSQDEREHGVLGIYFHVERLVAE